MRWNGGELGTQGFFGGVKNGTLVNKVLSEISALQSPKDNVPPDQQNENKNQ